MQERPGPPGHVTVGIALTGGEEWPTVRARVARLEANPVISNLWVFDERFNRDPWVTLGLIAGMTDRLVLGTCVTDPLVRHPALTGTAIATLAEATGGRAVLGLGAGVSGFAAMGIERRAPATALRSAIEFLRRFWASEARFSFESPSVAWRDGRLHFTPGSPIPIVVAGRGPKVLEVAGELSDMALLATFTDGPLLEYSLQRVLAGIARRASDVPPPRLGAWIYISVDDDPVRARDAVRHGIAVALWGSRPILDELGIAIPADLRRLMDEVPYAATPDVLDRAARLIPDDLIDTCSVAGTASDCVARLRRLVERGFGHLALWPFAPAGGTVDGVVDRLTSDVIPSIVRQSERIAT